MQKQTKNDRCCAPVLAASLSEPAAQELADILKALADPVRLRLVSMIAATPDNEGLACDFPQQLDKSQPTISHHLSQLVKAGVLVREQRGKWACFRLNKHRLASISAAFGGPPCC